MWNAIKCFLVINPLLLLLLLLLLFPDVFCELHTVLPWWYHITKSLNVRQHRHKAVCMTCGNSLCYSSSHFVSYMFWLRWFILCSHWSFSFYFILFYLLVSAKECYTKTSLAFALDNFANTWLHLGLIWRILNVFVLFPKDTMRAIFCS